MNQIMNALSDVAAGFIVGDVGGRPAASPANAGYLHISTAGALSWSDGTQWRVAAVYTAGTGLSLSGTEFSVDNPFTAGDKTKLDGIETGATADQTGPEIKSLYEAQGNTNAFTDALRNKLNGIANNANNYSLTDTAILDRAKTGRGTGDRGQVPEDQRHEPERPDPGATRWSPPRSAPSGPAPRPSTTPSPPRAPRLFIL